eukprot:CAMPEP_0172775614 /NCGR_PEP_ID=MMETSP1074-20121228/198291_1 /TAXON_ID=2916 /ORGANISM="Ceratium fusus, Strain PA161109" /LENGTH=176 /DNA_ID=CAMNT_0013612257 /DNA_START=1 /DNA_END=528 /DNA_ORIENTATION=-
MKKNHWHILAMGSYAAQKMLAKSAVDAVRHILFKVWAVVREATSKVKQQVKQGLKDYLQSLVWNKWNGRSYSRGFDKAPRFRATPLEQKEVNGIITKIASLWSNESHTCYKNATTDDVKAFEDCYFDKIKVEHDLTKSVGDYQTRLNITGQVASCVNGAVQFQKTLDDSRMGMQES